MDTIISSERTSLTSDKTNWSASDYSIVMMIYFYMMIETQIENRLKEIEENLEEMKVYNDLILDVRATIGAYEQELASGASTIESAALGGDGKTINTSGTIDLGKGWSLKYEVRDGEIWFKIKGKYNHKNFWGQNKSKSFSYSETFTFDGNQDLKHIMKEFTNNAEDKLKGKQKGNWYEYLNTFTAIEAIIERETASGLKDGGGLYDLLIAENPELTYLGKMSVEDDSIHELIEAALGIDSYDRNQLYSQDYWKEVIVTGLDAHVQAITKTNEIMMIKVQQLMKYMNMITDLMSQQIQEEYSTVRSVGGNF